MSSHHKLSTLVRALLIEAEGKWWSQELILLKVSVSYLLTLRSPVNLILRGLLSLFSKALDSKSCILGWATKALVPPL